MVKRVALSALLAVGMLGLAASPAAAAVKVVNGNFTGAKYSYGPNAGDPLPVSFAFAAGINLDPAFGWTDTGSGALTIVADYGARMGANNALGHIYAPDNPTGYKGNVYVTDGNGGYAIGTYLQQLLMGLTPGKTYTVSFLQASGSAYNALSTPDSVLWDVGFGGTIKYGAYGPLDPITGIPADTFKLFDAQISPSALMTNGADGTSPWNRQTATFTATSNTALLSFFANGSGAPPFALLADVSISAVPEPATWAMMILGFGVVGGAMRAAKRRSDERFDAKIRRITEGEAV